MKKMIFVVLAVLALSSSVFAANAGQWTPFSNLSTTSSAASYSAAQNVRGYRTKTVQVQGVAIAGHANAALSGTVLVQCGPTSNGPWATCTQSDRTAVSTTSNAILTWNDAAAYIRLSWAKTAGLVNAWINWTEN